jgi:hypothetical protein
MSMIVKLTVEFIQFSSIGFTYGYLRFTPSVLINPEGVKRE